MSISGQTRESAIHSAFRGLAWVSLLAWLLYVRFAWPSAEADLFPSPDAIQYTTSAWNMSSGLGYSVQLGGQLHPPRYPIGFPLTLVPVYLLGGSELHHAAWAVLLTSMLLFLPVAGFASALFGRGAALWAVLFVGLSPLLIQHSTRIMSEALSVLLVAVIYRFEARQSSSLLLGLLGGFAASVRYTNGMALLPSFLRILSRGAPQGRVRALLGMSFGVALFLAPMAWHHQAAFGSPTRDGYAYWQPERYENRGFTFAWEYAWKSPTVSWKRRPVGLFESYARDLAGISRHLYSPVVPLLALVGLALALRTERKSPDAPSLGRFLSYPLFLYVFYSFYYGEDRRFYLPVLVPVAAFAANGAQQICSRFSARFRPIVVLAIVAGLTATSLPDAWRGPSRQPQLRHFFTRTYDRVLPQDAILITSLDVLYLEYYFRRSSPRQVVAFDPAVAHATVIAPKRLPPPPHRSLPFDEFRLWALAHGGAHPVPLFDPSLAQALQTETRPLFLDSELPLRRIVKRMYALGYEAQPVSPPAARRLYRLHPRPRSLSAPVDPD